MYRQATARSTATGVICGVTEHFAVYDETRRISTMTTPEEVEYSEEERLRYGMADQLPELGSSALVFFWGGGLRFFFYIALNTVAQDVLSEEQRLSFLRASVYKPRRDSFNNCSWSMAAHCLQSSIRC